MKYKKEEKISDLVLPFEFDDLNTRGGICRLEKSFNNIQKQHEYPFEVSALLAEAVILTVLIGQSIKLRWKLSVQIRGSGPSKLIATDYVSPKSMTEKAKVRAYASFRDNEMNSSFGSPFSKIGEGYFAVLIDQGDGMKPYQGITELTGSCLADCASSYFLQSEQIPTKFFVAAKKVKPKEEFSGWIVGGLMIQHLPEKSEDHRACFQNSDFGQEQIFSIYIKLFHPEISNHLDLDYSGIIKSDNWGRVSFLFDTITEEEILNKTLSLEELLFRLFSGEKTRVYKTRGVTFGCTCSAIKVKQTMSIYSEKEILKMTNEKGQVTADCQFCGSHYVFETNELGEDVSNVSQ